ncbi:MAG: hypothetical protein LRY55_13430 [Leadbetterella sp.]|nr:hypothetical protein [Leadbetterella sp.]
MDIEAVLGKLKFVLSLVVPVCYIGMGIYVISEKIFIVKIEPPMFAYALGGVLIAYGVFRIYRAIKQ